MCLIFITLEEKCTIILNYNVHLVIINYIM